MPRPDTRRTLVWAILIAGMLGFAAGWLTRVWTAQTPESRARDAVERMRERAHEFTR